MRPGVSCQVRQHADFHRPLLVGFGSSLRPPPKALPKAPETQGVRTRRNSGNQVVLQIALSSTSSSSCVLGPLMRWYSMLPSAACSQQLISLHGPTLSCWSGTIVPATQLLPLAPKLGGSSRVPYALAKCVASLSPQCTHRTLSLS